MTNAGARYFIHGFARARVRCPRSFSSDRTFCFGSSPADFGPASPRAIQSDCGEEGASRPRYSLRRRFAQQHPRLGPTRPVRWASCHPLCANTTLSRHIRQPRCGGGRPPDLPAPRP